MDDRTLSLIILVFAAAFIVGTWMSPGQLYMEYTGEGPSRPVPQPPLSGDESFATISVPAVNADGDGIITNIAVQAMPGTGRTLTNIDKIFFWVDTQHSIRVARSVAEGVTGLDMKSYDLIYTITADASIIEGPSAGTALTVATIAALQGKKIRDGVMITGSMEEDGSVGSAAGIKEKAIAARDSGATRFLIPEGIIKEKGTEREAHCTSMNGMDYCEVNYAVIEEDLEEAVGIEITEVSDINEVLEMMLA